MELSVIALAFVASVGLGLAGAHALLSLVLFLVQRAAARVGEAAARRPPMTPPAMFQ
jgi:hypothetical protein